MSFIYCGIITSFESFIYGYNLTAMPLLLPEICFQAVKPLFQIRSSNEASAESHY